MQPPHFPWRLLRSEAIALRTAEFFAGGAELRDRFEREIEEWRKVFDWDHMVGTIEKLLTEYQVAPEIRYRVP